jgi:hypothetical protein
LTANIADFNFDVGDPAVTKSLTFSKTINAVEQCPYAYKLEIWSTANSAWEVWAAQNTFETWTASTGSLSFRVTNFSDAGQTIRSRISVTSTNSEHVNASVSDEFIITVRDKCTT